MSDMSCDVQLVEQSETSKLLKSPGRNRSVHGVLILGDALVPHGEVLNYGSVPFICRWTLFRNIFKTCDSIGNFNRFHRNGMKWFGHFKKRCLKIQETVWISFAVAVLILQSPHKTTITGSIHSCFYGKTISTLQALMGCKPKLMIWRWFCNN